MPIRNARPDDFDSLIALYADMLSYENKLCDQSINADFAQSELGHGYIRQIADYVDGYLGVVYEDDDTIKGFAALRDVATIEYAHRINVKQAQIQTLVVGEEWRGQGIGRALIAECQKIAKINGYTHLKIVSLATNDRARLLYKGTGFHEQEIIHEMIL
jgi:ribosomal protein S18 acetylase RimI-like enzyme